jgi:hypothetical protein
MGTSLEPESFSPQAIDPETARFNQALEKTIAEAPPVMAFAPARVRAARGPRAKRGRGSGGRSGPWTRPRTG